MQDGQGQGVKNNEDSEKYGRKEQQMRGGRDGKSTEVSKEGMQ
jgi:hypothetical protein